MRRAGIFHANRLALGLAAVTFLGGLANGGVYEIYVQPVDPPAGFPAYPAGSETVSADTVLIPAGVPVQVWFDVKVSSFGFGAIKTAQWEFQASSLASGTGAPVSLYRPACVTNADCTTAGGVGPASVCSPDVSNPNTCSPAYVDSTNPNYGWTNPVVTINVVSDQVRIEIVDETGTPGYEYLGTIVVDVPALASGTYQLELNPNPAVTYLLNGDGANVPISTFYPAHLVVYEPDCGTGFLDVPEETCDIFVSPESSTGLYFSFGVDSACNSCFSCRPPTDANSCTCCGDGVLQTGEMCDGASGGCGVGESCMANCQCSGIPECACPGGECAVVLSSALEILSWAQDLDDQCADIHLNGYSDDMDSDGSGTLISGSRGFGGASTRSTDGGESWQSGPAIPEVSPPPAMSPANPKSLRLASDRANTWLWVTDHTDGADNTRYLGIVRSEDDGANWSAEPSVNLAAYDDNVPSGLDTQLASLGNGVWIIVGNYKAAGGFSQRDLIVLRSTDNGATWSAPAVLHPFFLTMNTPVLTPAIGTDYQGNAVVTWASTTTQDENGTPIFGRSLWWSYSGDAGLTWSSPKLLSDGSRIASSSGGYHSGSSSNMPARVSGDGQGNWVVLWPANNNYGGVDYGVHGAILMAHSSDDAQTWSASVPIPGDGASDPRVPTLISLDAKPSGEFALNVRYQPDGPVGTGDVEYLVSASADHGVNWSPPTLVTSVPYIGYNSNLGASEVSPLAGDQWAVFSPRAVLADYRPDVPTLAPRVQRFRFSADCDDDGLPDQCMINSDLVADCNDNDRPDACDIADSVSEDCNSNGTPDECESGCETATENDVDDDETVTLNPGGGGTDPASEAQVTFTNESGATGDIEVNESTDPVLPDEGAFSVLGTTMVINSTVSNGDFFARISIPFNAADLGSADPLSLDLVWFDTTASTWVLAVAGNTTNSPGHGTPNGDRSASSGGVTPTLSSLSADLGDYGVFWNTSTLAGFVWANVDHFSIFRIGVPREGPTALDAVCFTGATPTATPCGTNADCAGGQACRLKSRFLSINPADTAAAATPSALQVKVISVPGAPGAVNASPYNYPAMVNDVWWVGAATARTNDQSNYITAPLACTGTPLIQDWNAVGNIHIYGDGIVPGATYEIRSCATVSGPCSAPLILATARHGDTRDAYNLTNFADISALVGEFQAPNAPSSLLKSHAWITPSNMTSAMGSPFGFNQISAGVTAFSGGAPPAPTVGANQCP